MSASRIEPALSAHEARNHRFHLISNPTPVVLVALACFAMQAVMALQDALAERVAQTLSAEFSSEERPSNREWSAPDRPSD